MSAFISVIICTYNRAALLHRALRSLSGQTLDKKYFEIIVVDDGSHDDTIGVCERMRGELPNLIYISCGTNMGAPKARNRGIEEASGEYLLFTDDDCIPAGDWVERMGEALEKEQVVAGAVASRSENYLILCHNIAQFHPFMPGKKAGLVEFIAGANMAFHRSVLKDLGGFVSKTGHADDMDIILRARLKGYRIFFVPDALVTHVPARSTLYGILKYSAVHASTTIDLRNQYRSLLNTPFIFGSPALILAAAPLIALKVTSKIYLSNPELLRYICTAPVVYALKLAWCWGAANGLRKRSKEPIRRDEQRS
jgi:glycosyltransferase involved in cell wall biosynthesis